MGPEMMENFRQQAGRLGADIRFGYVSSVDFSSLPHKVVVDETKTILADTVIISTGASAKWLGLPSEAKYNGFGVSACAVCDGFFFRGQDVVIVGAGDTAAEEATYLANLCRKVTMLIRRDAFRASKAMVHRVMNTPNIEVLYNTETVEIVGDDKVVTGVKVINNKTGTEKLIPVAGFFVAIGHQPNTEIFKDWVEMDETGYIITKPDSTQTPVLGVFCCGDAQDHIFRQAITAAGTGCMAAIEAERYLAAKQHRLLTEQLISAEATV